LTDIAAEREVPVLINIHEVDLAIEHADRIVGLHDGELVFEGPPAELDEQGLDQVYRGAEIPDNTGGSTTAPADSNDGGVLSDVDRSIKGET
jgi:phosphonate transport system ATP-binding protein